MKKMDSAEVGSGEFKVWCEQCSIRIAPNEARVAGDGKIYHQHCYEKYFAPTSKTSVPSDRSGTALESKR
jgi:hypothetical protein